MEPGPAKPALSPAAIAALHRGNKIEAIRLVREEQRIGLKEAKDLVEAYLRAEPAVQARFAAARSQSGQNLWWWLAAALAAVLVYILVTSP